MGKQAPVADPKDLSNRPKRWYPFSDGSRSCVGQSLAYMNLVGTLAALLARFHFRLADQVMHPFIITHACIAASSCLYACLHRCYAFWPEVLFCFVTHTSIHASDVASHIQTMQLLVMINNICGVHTANLLSINPESGKLSLLNTAG